ncbi:Mitochondrial distribution and morphology protein 12, partial [Coemansia spiralis]
MFGSWDPGTPSRSGSSSGSSTSSTSNEGGAPGHQPAPRSQFLRALYGRAAAARRGLLGRGSSPASESVASSNSASEATALAAAGHSMLGGLRRAEPQATVELARPAPEVEFSRGAHIVRPMLRSTAPADSSSLLSLRASQHSGEFVGSPLSHMSMRDRAASSLASVRPGTRAASSQGGRASGHAAAPLSLACFGDEQDAPFRLNAVEIAAQDDKQECAFLPQERHGLGAEIERGRSILPMMIGQIQPTTAVGSEPASVSSGGPAQPPASGKLRAEREAIALLSRRAQQRLDGGGSGLAGILPQMALRHVQEIVRQLLDEIEVPADSGWDQVILDLVANAVGRVQPNVRGGDKMDLRHYVRIKRIP